MVMPNLHAPHLHFLQIINSTHNGIGKYANTYANMLRFMQRIRADLNTLKGEQEDIYAARLAFGVGNWIAVKSAYAENMRICELLGEYVQIYANMRKSEHVQQRSTPSLSYEECCCMMQCALDDYYRCIPLTLNDRDGSCTSNMFESDNYYSTTHS